MLYNQPYTWWFWIGTLITVCCLLFLDRKADTTGPSVARIVVVGMFGSICGAGGVSGISSCTIVEAIVVDSSKVNGVGLSSVGGVVYSPGGVQGLTDFECSVLCFIIPQPRSYLESILSCSFHFNSLVFLFDPYWCPNSSSLVTCISFAWTVTQMVHPGSFRAIFIAFCMQTLLFMTMQMNQKSSNFDSCSARIIINHYCSLDPDNTIHMVTMGQLFTGLGTSYRERLQRRIPCPECSV